MVRLLMWGMFLLLLSACAPLEPATELPVCTSRPSQEQLWHGGWLQQPGTWLLRQSALLEIGRRKIPLEGLLQLNTGRGEARLVAMNEVGLVMFDLQLDAEKEQLQRALPQLQQQPGFARGVAKSLRRIFLQPTPLANDQLQLQPGSEQLWRTLPGGRLDFVFDCEGKRVETRELSDEGDWRIEYRDYQDSEGVPVPQQIVFNDYRHRVKLSLWLREVTHKDE